MCVCAWSKGVGGVDCDGIARACRVDTFRVWGDRVCAQVDTADDGAEAVKATARVSYDVVLMDGFMPIKTGWHATYGLLRPPWFLFLVSCV